MKVHAFSFLALVFFLPACVSRPPAPAPAPLALPPTYTHTPPPPTATIVRPSPTPTPTPTVTPFAPALIEEASVTRLTTVKSWEIWWLDAVAWSDDGSLFAVVGSPTEDIEDQEVAVFSVQTLERLWSLRGDYSDVAFSPDGANVAATGFNGTDLIDTKTGSLWSHPACAGGDYVAYSKDGRFIAQARSYGRDATDISLVNATTGDCLVTLTYPGRIRSLALSPGGDYLTGQFGTATDEVVVSWAASTGTKLCHSSGWPPIYSPDGSLLVIPSIEDWTTEIREPASCRMVHKFTGEGYPMGFRPDGTLVLSAEDQTLSIWDIRSFEKLRAMPGLPYHGALREVSPDWRSLLVYNFGEHAYDPGSLLLMQAPE